MQQNQNQTRRPMDEEAVVPDDIPADAPDRLPPVDAREDKEKLKENRENLGVDEAHQTPDMKERHRGTFP